jgi:hypothetical protein
MLNRKIKLISKFDPLKYLLAKAALIGRIAKWDIKAIKGNIIKNKLVDAPVEDHHPLTTIFIDKSILATELSNQWTLYFDGSYTQHSSGVGILFMKPQGYCISKAYRITFPYTNNMLEYEVLITRLKMVIEWKIKELQVYNDSQLVIRKVNDEY